MNGCEGWSCEGEEEKVASGMRECAGWLNRSGAALPSKEARGKATGRAVTNWVEAGAVSGHWAQEPWRPGAGPRRDSSALCALQEGEMALAGSRNRPEGPRSGEAKVELTCYRWRSLHPGRYWIQPYLGVCHQSRRARTALGLSISRCTEISSYPGLLQMVPGPAGTSRSSSVQDSDWGRLGWLVGWSQQAGSNRPGWTCVIQPDVIS